MLSSKFNSYSATYWISWLKTNRLIKERTKIEQRIKVLGENNMKRFFPSSIMLTPFLVKNYAEDLSDHEEQEFEQTDSDQDEIEEWGPHQIVE